MTNSTFHDLSDSLDRLARDIMRACRRAWRELDTMPLSSVLLWCVVLAMVISLLPLALCLFVLFLGLKIVAGAFIVERRASSRQPDLHKD